MNNRNVFPKHANTNNQNFNQRRWNNTFEPAQYTGSRVTSMADQFPSQDVSSQYYSPETEHRKSLIEKIKERPACKKIVYTFTILALASATVFNFTNNQHRAAEIDHHYLTEWENPEQHDIHQAAQIKVGDQDVVLQVIRNNTDEASNTIENVGYLKANSTFNVGHYATSHSKYDQMNEKNAGTKVIAILRDDIPEEDREINSLNEDPYFYVTINTNNPNLTLTDTAVADINE